MHFEFDTPNGTMKFHIWFKYTLHDGKREVLALIDEEDAPGTTFAAGSALCAKSDQFRKDTGRKVALTKALRSQKIANVCRNNRYIEKDFRTAAWQAYHKRAEQPKGVATNG